jgi:polar amino acid transport system substrate-binding protein
MKSHRSVFAIAAAAAVAFAVAGCAAPADSPEGEDDLGLIAAGKLTLCVNLDTPPNIYAEEDGTPIGVEIDIVHAMSDVMGLEPEFKEYAFSGLLPALQAGQCDTIMSSLYIKPEREEIANFVPYLISGSGVAVSKENPAGVTGYDDTLCGVRAIGITGATGAALLEAKSAECEAAGLPKIEVTLLDKATDGLQQVIAGQADVFMDTSELVSFFEEESDGAFVAVGESVDTIKIGAASIKSNTALHEALQAAFDAIVEDGRYGEILTEWNFEALDIANG